MRWSELFDDLEGQLAHEQVLELQTEVADRTRRERATVHLADRLAAAVGKAVSLRVQGAGLRDGVLDDLGQDWTLLAHAGGPGERGRTRATLVPLAAINRIDALGPRADGRQGTLMRRFGLGYALRALSRDRAVVTLTDRDGAQVVGTIDRVGADHLDIAEHAEDVPRRREHVRGVRVVPFTALASVTSS